jgi:hypothetical protein
MRLTACLGPPSQANSPTRLRDERVTSPTEKPCPQARPARTLSRPGEPQLAPLPCPTRINQID